MYGIEQETRDSILYVENQLGKDKKETAIMIDNMTFGQKIDFIEKKLQKVIKVMICIYHL